MQSLRFGLALCLLAVLGAGALAQAGSQAPPLGTPTAPSGPVILPPLVFLPELPTDPVASVDGVPIPASDILKIILDQNFTTGVTALVMGKIAELELQKAKVTLTDGDIVDELNGMLAQMAPGKTLEDIEREGSTSMTHLRSNARATRAWKKLFWTAQNIPEDQRTNQTNTMLHQFFMKTAPDNYDRRIRGANPAPAAGTVAQIVDKTTGNEILVGASEALDFLMGLVKLSGMTDARKEAIERRILESEMKAKNVTVTEEEVATWAAHMRTVYPPPFSWEQILRATGSTAEKEMERWRRIQAWKRITGVNLTQEQLDQFLADNKSFFLGKTKKVSHVLFRTTDEVTGLPLPTEQRAAAESSAKEALRKLQEGVDFGWLAETYSEDTVTAKGKGRLAAAIKQWGGGLDPAFQNAVWSMEKVGELTGPVQSSFGWHVIKLEEVNNPAAKQEPDWKIDRYQEYIREQYETQLMTKWFAEVSAARKIELEADERLFSLKKRQYFGTK